MGAGLTFLESRLQNSEWHVWGLMLLHQGEPQTEAVRAEAREDAGGKLGVTPVGLVAERGPAFSACGLQGDGNWRLDCSDSEERSEI